MAVTRVSRDQPHPGFIVHDGTSWTHENGGAVPVRLADHGHGDRLRRRCPQAGGVGFFHGDMVCAAIKKADAYDATCETLSPHQLRGLGRVRVRLADRLRHQPGVRGHRSKTKAAQGPVTQIAITGTSLVCRPARLVVDVGPPPSTFVPQI